MPSSSSATVEPAAVKKRGRPRKVAVEDSGTPVVAEAKKTAAGKKATVKTVAAKEKLVEPKKEKKTVAKKVAPEHPTPATPATSKILEEVRAKGTLKKTLPTQTAKTESVGDVSKTTATVQSKSASSPPSSQTKPVAIPTQDSQAKTPPIQHTTTTKNSPPTHQQQKTTTIPLPQKPLPAPSPLHQHSTLRASPSSRPQQPPPHHQTPSNPYPQRRPPGLSNYQHSTRIIEPTPDIRLPPKYKPAARRVTAIIVSLPIVIVFGYELWARWKGKKVAKKFGDVHLGVDARGHKGVGGEAVVEREK